MWFNKKDNSKESAEPRTRRSRTSDMRSELGLSDSDGTRATRRVGTSKTVTQDAASNTYNEDVLLNDLKVRARRRLIGALVLLAAAFVVLPWVFDDKRKQASAVVSVSVPEQKIQFDVQNPRATDTAVNTDNLKKPEETKSDKKPADDAASTAQQAKPEVKAAADKPTESKVAEPSKAKFVVHIGVVSSKADLDALNKRLAAKGVKPNTETIKTDGEQKTRVRLGPFDSQAAAQAAADKIKGAAKNPVVIEVK